MGVLENVFPARAGMSPLLWGFVAVLQCVPRASGDEPTEGMLRGDFETCSPRERG